MAPIDDDDEMPYVQSFQERLQLLISEDSSQAMHSQR
jgi:hypothetical protein